MADRTDTTKLCCSCKVWLPRNQFYNCKATSDGLLPKCKNCRRLGKLAERRADPEKARATERARVRNKEQTNAASRRWYAAHKETARAWSKAWGERNRERRRAARIAWKAKNAERIAVVDSAWRRANPEKVRLSQARHDAANPEKRRQKNILYRAANPEKVRAAERAWKTANGERLRAFAASWRLANREKVLANKAIRRARKKAAPGAGWTVDDIASIFKAQRGRCALCREKLPTNYHRDHIVPLAKGGAHDRRNCQLTCQPCNQRKSDRDPIDHARILGLLI